VLLPHASVAVHVAVLVCRQLVPLATKFDTTLTLLQLSANTGALKLNAVPHWLVVSAPAGVVTVGAVVSTRIMV
jgi:hypothetical protein